MLSLPFGTFYDISCNTFHGIFYNTFYSSFCSVFTAKLVSTALVHQHVPSNFSSRAGYGEITMYNDINGINDRQVQRRPMFITMFSLLQSVQSSVTSVTCVTLRRPGQLQMVLCGRD